VKHDSRKPPRRPEPFHYNALSPYLVQGVGAYLFHQFCPHEIIFST
jgi:hypothetical protein